MALNDTLAELAKRREGYKSFREAVERDLAKEKALRLAAEEHAIDILIFRAAAEGASTGQIKRAYGTKDHRTISERLKAHAAEIDAIRTRMINDIGEMPDWLSIDDDRVIVNLGNRGEATFNVHQMEDGGLMFMTDEPLWDLLFQVKNEAVELLDGKVESESEEASVAAKFWRNR